MFGRKRIKELERKVRDLEYSITTVQQQADQDRHITVIEKYAGYHTWRIPRAASIRVQDVLTHILDKLGIELTYIQGRPKEDPRVGIKGADNGSISTDKT